jgi:predicted DNA-binding protein
MTEEMKRRVADNGAYALRLPPPLAERVRKLAAAEGNQIPAVLRRLVRERLDQIEARAARQ